MISHKIKFSNPSINLISCVILRAKMSLMKWKTCCIELLNFGGKQSKCTSGKMLWLPFFLF